MSEFPWPQTTFERVEAASLKDLTTDTLVSKWLSLIYELAGPGTKERCDLIGVSFYIMQRGKGIKDIARKIGGLKNTLEDAM